MAGGVRQIRRAAAAMHRESVDTAGSADSPSHCPGATPAGACRRSGAPAFRHSLRRCAGPVREPHAMRMNAVDRSLWRRR